MSATAEHSTAVGRRATSRARRTRRWCAGRCAYVDDLRLPGHAARRGAALAARARPDRRRSTPRRAKALPGVHAVLTGPESLEVIGPLAAVLRRGGRGARDRGREGALRRRGRGRRRRRVPLRRRGRARARRGRVRAARPLVADAEAAMAEGAALVHENLGSNVVYQHAFTLRRRRRRLRRRRPRRAPRAALAARHRRAAGDQRRGRAVRRARAGGWTCWSNTNLLNFAAWVMSATLGVAPAPAQLPPAVGGRLVRLEALPRPSRSASRARWPRSPGRPVKFMEDRADNLLASDAQAPERAHVAELALDADGTFRSLRDQGRRRLRRLLHARHRGQHQPAVADRRPVPDRQRHLRRHRGADQQEPAGRAARRGLGRHQLGAGAAGRRRGRRARHRRRRAAPAQPHPARRVPVQDPHRQLLRLRRLPGGAGSARWSWPTSTGGGPSRSAPAPRGATSASAWRCAQQRSTYYASEFWFHNIGAPAPFTTTAESVRMRIGPTGGITATLFAPFWGNSQETVDRAAHRGRAGRRPGRGRDRPRPDHARPALGGPRHQAAPLMGGRAWNPRPFPWRGASPR